jgi:hypothetical protein
MDKKKSKSKKLIKCGVKQPRSAYNYFFKSLQKPKSTKLADFQKIAAKKWKELEKEDRNHYIKESIEDSKRYENDIKMLKKIFKIIQNNDYSSRKKFK